MAALRIACLKKLAPLKGVGNLKQPLCVRHLSETLLVTRHPEAKPRTWRCRRKGASDCFRSGNRSDGCFLSTSLRPAPTRSRAALVSGGREGRRAEGGGGAEGRRALGCELGGGRGGESPSAGVGAGKPGANVDNRLEVSPGEPPSPPLQRPGGSGAEGHRPGLLLPGGPERRLRTSALRGRRAGAGPRVRRPPPQTPLSREFPSTREPPARGRPEGRSRGVPAPHAGAGPRGRRPGARRGGVKGLGGVEEARRLGRALRESGAKRGRGSGAGACVG